MEKKNVLGIYDVLDEVLAPCVMRQEETDGTTWRYTFVSAFTGRIAKALERHGFERERQYNWSEMVEENGRMVRYEGMTFTGGVWVAKILRYGSEAELEVGLA